MTQLLSSHETAPAPPEILKVQFLDLRDPGTKYLVSASVKVVNEKTDILPDANDSSIVKLARFAQGVDMLAGENYFYDPARGNALVLFQLPDNRVHGIIKTDRNMLGRSRMTYLGLMDAANQTIIAEKRRVDSREQFSFGAGMRITTFIRQAVPPEALARLRARNEPSEHVSALSWLYGATTDFLDGQHDSFQNPVENVMIRMLGGLTVEAEGF